MSLPSLTKKGVEKKDFFCNNCKLKIKDKRTKKPFDPPKKINSLEQIKEERGKEERCKEEKEEASRTSRFLCFT